MSLVDIWLKNRSQLIDKKLSQIISFAGEGSLRDNSAASKELRNYLKVVPSSVLKLYAEQCLENSFKDSGLALQDVVNEIGCRIGFKVTNGRYRGLKDQIGYDGLWTSPFNSTILVEVKTSDAYRINLSTIIDYKRVLIKKKIYNEEDLSVLIVVGREDTGDLEAQVRGSKYAWDIRLISIDALINLMNLKEKVEEPQIAKRIHDILIPREFTKLDGIIDVVFSTAEEVKQKEVEIDGGVLFVDKKEKKFIPVSFRDSCISKIEKNLNLVFVKRSWATYSTSDEKTGLLCAISKLHRKNNGFWFAFHPYQKEFLEKFKSNYVAFGCGSEKNVLLIPLDILSKNLDKMNMTHMENRSYWHIFIVIRDNKWILKLKKEYTDIEITKYLLK